MTTTTQVAFTSFRSAQAGRWQMLRDLLGGAAVLAAAIALWTATWAAVAGPLSAPPAGGDARIAEYRAP